MILIHILLFGKASLYTSANALLLNETMNYIKSTNRFEESSFLVFCIFLLYLQLYLFFPYPNVFFLWLNIHFHLVLRFVFIYLLKFLFTISFFLYQNVSWIFKAPGDCNFLLYLFECTIFILENWRIKRIKWKIN